MQHSATPPVEGVLLYLIGCRVRARVVVGEQRCEVTFSSRPSLLQRLPARRSSPEFPAQSRGGAWAWPESAATSSDHSAPLFSAPAPSHVRPSPSPPPPSPPPSRPPSPLHHRHRTTVAAANDIR